MTLWDSNERITYSETHGGEAGNTSERSRNRNTCSLICPNGLPWLSFHGSGVTRKFSRGSWRSGLLDFFDKISGFTNVGSLAG